MVKFLDFLKGAWVYMLEPPWRHTTKDGDGDLHWVGWLHGWVSALIGVILGALFAPSIVQRLGLSSFTYVNAVLIGIAVTAGFLAQFIGWILIYLKLVRSLDLLAQGDWANIAALYVIRMGISGICVWAVFYYWPTFVTNQHAISTAFVDGLLIKTLLIPAVWGAIRSRAFNWFMKWLRGGKDTKKAE